MYSMHFLTFSAFHTLAMQPAAICIANHAVKIAQVKKSDSPASYNMLLLATRCSNAHSIALNLIDFNSRLHSFANFLHCKVHSSHSQAIHISNNLHVSSHRLQINSKINRAARLCPVVCPRRKICFILRYSELFLTKNWRETLKHKKTSLFGFHVEIFSVFQPDTLSHIY